MVARTRLWTTTVKRRSSREQRYIVGPGKRPCQAGKRRRRHLEIMHCSQESVGVHDSCGQNELPAPLGAKHASPRREPWVRGTRQMLVSPSGAKEGCLARHGGAASRLRGESASVYRNLSPLTGLPVARRRWSHGLRRGLACCAPPGLRLFGHVALHWHVLSHSSPRTCSSDCRAAPSIQDHRQHDGHPICALDRLPQLKLASAALSPNV